MAAREKGRDDTPHVGALRFGPAPAGALYLLLVGSAALALAAQRFPDALPRGIEAAAPWVFLAFLLCFGAYRLVLVQAKKYQAGKAFLQVGTAALFFMLLLPWKRPEPLPADGVLAALSDASPALRAIGAEVARTRPDGLKYAPQLARALSDPDATVRREAHQSLVQLSGVDLGAPDESASASRAWRERYP